MKRNTLYTVAQNVFFVNDLFVREKKRGGGKASSPLE